MYTVNVVLDTDKLTLLSEEARAKGQLGGDGVKIALNSPLKC